MSSSINRLSLRVREKISKRNFEGNHPSQATLVFELAFGRIVVICLNHVILDEYESAYACDARPYQIRAERHWIHCR